MNEAVAVARAALRSLQRKYGRAPVERAVHELMWVSPSDADLLAMELLASWRHDVRKQLDNMMSVAVLTRDAVAATATSEEVYRLLDAWEGAIEGIVVALDDLTRIHKSVNERFGATWSQSDGQPSTSRDMSGDT